MPYSPGEIVQVWWKDRQFQGYYDGIILTPRKSGARVRYIGYGEDWDEFVLYYRIKKTKNTEVSNDLTVGITKFVKDRCAHVLEEDSGTDTSHDSSSNSDSGTESSDDEPLADFKNLRATISEWELATEKKVPPPNPTERVKVASNKQPFEYFEEYFTEENIDKILHDTNIEERRRNPNSTWSLSKDRFKVFLGVCKWMSLVKMGNVQYFWSRKTRFAPIADYMCRNEWEKIKNKLYFCDSSILEPQSKTSKFQLLIDIFNDRANTIPSDGELSIDEQILPYKGKQTTIQSKKPKRWGYKFFVLSGSFGIIFNIDLYRGANSSPEVIDPKIGKSGQVVLDLLKIIPENSNIRVYFDNWFNSPTLMEKFAEKRIWGLSTLRINRATGLTFDIKNLKKAGRGSSQEQKCVMGRVELRSVMLV